MIAAKYGSYFEKFSLVKLKSFMLHRLGKLYVLYIVSMIPFFFSDAPAVISMVLQGDKAWQNYAIKYGINIVLLQGFFINMNSVNGAAWFLSCMLFLYCITPLLIKLINALSKKKLYWMLAMVFCFVLIAILEPLAWSYHSPFFRVFQYMIGLLLGNMPSSLKERTGSWQKRIGILGLILSLSVIFINVSQLCVIVAVCSLVLWTSQKRESCFPLFPEVGNFFQKTGKMSGEIFLIHYPVVTILGDLLKRNWYSGEIVVAIFHGGVLLIVTWILSDLFSRGYKKWIMTKDKARRILDEAYNTNSLL